MTTTFKIASWNVNSIKIRMPHVMRWVNDHQPDLLMLQEIKCLNDQFPEFECTSMGYHATILGQKSYNGVAILSREPVQVMHTSLPDMNETHTQARFLDIALKTPYMPWRILNLYVPNGNPMNTDKWAYKQAWLDALMRHARSLLALECPVVMAGDYNIIPEPLDVYHPDDFHHNALYDDAVRRWFRSMQNEGYYDGFRCKHLHDRTYSYWDYQNRAWQNNDGFRIDHMLLSPFAVDQLVDCDIDSKPRDWDQPSDHVPIFAIFNRK